MDNSLRQYLALVRRRPRFAIGLIVVAAAGALGEVMAYTSLITGPSQSAVRQLAAGFGDAFINLRRARPATPPSPHRRCPAAGSAAFSARHRTTTRRTNAG
jgi:hypothetical protein